MDIETTLNKMLAQETTEGMDMFSEEELLSDNTQVVSTTVKKATTLSQQR